MMSPVLWQGTPLVGYTLNDVFFQLPELLFVSCIFFLLFSSLPVHCVSELHGGARCSSVVRAFAHGAMGRWIDPSWGGIIEVFLVQPNVLSVSLNKTFFLPSFLPSSCRTIKFLFAIRLMHLRAQLSRPTQKLYLFCFTLLFKPVNHFVPLQHVEG